MATKMMTLFPQGTLLAAQHIQKKSPVFDTRNFKRAQLHLRVDGFQGVAGPPFTTFDVACFKSNDGRNFVPASTNFTQVNSTGVACESDEIIEVTDLAAFFQLQYTIDDTLAGAGYCGVTFHIIGEFYTE